MPQRVLITGGFGALGAAVAEAFHSAGHAVALIDRGQGPSGDARAVRIGGADISDPVAARTAFLAAEAALGGADVLVNVAGGFRFESVREGAPDTWDALYAMNLKTCVNMCRVAAERLEPGGCIVNVGAAAAARAAAGMGPYAASKSGVARLTESLAEELAGRIRVNAVAPGVIDTPRNRADMAGADFSRWTRPDAIAEVIVFLASPGAGAINGAVIATTNAP